ncbi:hypothetical protein [Streptomyces sp. NPDC014623]|uniref:hypothetical protein n=1 Tax=Streptomyces sp. NPDC014623 TaxID=3364875 RepID=UPI0036F9B896
MAMTMKVYEVNRDGGIRVIRPEAEVLPLKTPEARHAYPACQCDQCDQSKRPS